LTSDDNHSIITALGEIMNPQPQPYIGNFIAFIFICVFFYHAFKSYISGAAINLNEIDLITVGYVEPSDNITIVNVDNTSNNFESQQLYIDCIDALYTLGMKKSEAKKRAKMIFSTTNPQPKTVQDFLILALRTN
jgi:hypothetical protein